MASAVTVCVLGCPWVECGASVEDAQVRSPPTATLVLDGLGTAGLSWTAGSLPLVLDGLGTARWRLSTPCSERHAGLSRPVH